jgi:hypothetical protein
MYDPLPACLAKFASEGEPSGGQQGVTLLSEQYRLLRFKYTVSLKVDARGSPIPRLQQQLPAGTHGILGGEDLLLVRILPVSTHHASPGCRTVAAQGAERRRNEAAASLTCRSFSRDGEI